MSKAHLLILFLVLLIGIDIGRARHIPGKLSKGARVCVLTVGPADPAYTAFGHTAIRLQDPRHQIDQVYNYGTFDFESPGFFFKFLYGDLNYRLSVVPFEQFKEANVKLGRSIVSQTLNLSQSQVNALVKKLEQNALPGNRSYQYQFFSQNCVTQVRDLMSAQIAASPFRKGGAVILSGSTYRQKLRVYLTNRPWMELGVDLMLGAGADKPLTEHGQNFLPNTLRFTLANERSLAGNQIVQSSKTIAPATVQAQGFTIPPILVSWAIFSLVVAFTGTSLLLRWQGWWLDQILFGGVGLMGLVMAFGAFISLHQPLHHNWNLLWALPTHLGIAAGLKLFNRNKWLRLYLGMTLVLNGGVLIAWPIIPQKLSFAIIPIIGSLIVRSAFRLYMTLPKRSCIRRWTTTGNHLSSQEMNIQSAKTQ